LTAFFGEYANAQRHDDFGRIAKETPQYLDRLWVQWNPPLAAGVCGNWGRDVSVNEFFLHWDPRVDRKTEPETPLVILLSEHAGGIRIVCHHRSDLVSA